jgi:ATP-dependent Lhr-like helicase
VTVENLFHPITSGWFRKRFGVPTDPQALGWPPIAAGRNVLIAAPTGSGKTLAAFLWCIDCLLRRGLAGNLADETQVVYVSPLKALSNDVQRNLQLPLAELQAEAQAAGFAPPVIRTMVRTGDTPASERQAMVRRPPNIIVTTPESLYLLLTAARGRELLRTVNTVVVDEIHALARDKRGSHLTLSLERLEALCPAPPVRIGLSATQRPVDELARFLVGARRVDAAGQPDCQIIDTGHVRTLDLGVEVPPSELSAVCSHETWDEIYERLTQRIQSHRSTLIFVNTRRLAERLSYRLTHRLGEGAVASHHGSLSRAIRLDAEQRLKAGKLKAIVATASLELGIDIGFIDLVCQIGSPRSIATFLQRVGRSGHALDRVPKGRLFPLSRDELLECLALLRAVRLGRLDNVEIPSKPLDVLAQQIIAACVHEAWDEDRLFDVCRAAWPYRNLSRREFDELLEMLSEGVCAGALTPALSTDIEPSGSLSVASGRFRTARPGSSGRRGAYLHRDQIHHRLRARRNARLAAITSGGVIPETGDFRVVTKVDRTFVGTVNEDFALESLAGDVFLLGNTSWRVQYVRGGEMVVADAPGAPATIPFWLGEAPARTIELSEEVATLRQDVADRLSQWTATRPAQTEAMTSSATVELQTLSPEENATANWLMQQSGVDQWAARQAVSYVAAQQAAVGFVPTQRKIAFERFFDDSGGMQLVIHSPWGARINRAWGLALRKRFCRTFDFELQASADDDGIVLSLGPQHSFAIEHLFRIVNPSNGRQLLIQALLAVPMFRIRWRWNVTRALAVLRQRGAKRIPPNLQRMQADDLLAAVFPEQAGCFENHAGDIALPDHPLVRQTVHDCLNEAMDVERWQKLLEEIESGAVELVACDTREPSPFSYQRLNANPYAFLDDAPLEERRARAVATRRSLADAHLADLGRLDPGAIEQVKAEVWPTVRDAEELHDALLWMIALPESAAETQWSQWFGELVSTGRATTVHFGDSRRIWVAAERWPLVRAALPESVAEPDVVLPGSLANEPAGEFAVVELCRGQLELASPTTARQLAANCGLRQSAVEAALEALEAEGFVLRGNFTGTVGEIEWCQRRLLARIHRLTLDGARRKVQPVDAADFFRFLLEFQHVAAEHQQEGRSGLRDLLGQLQGFEAPAGEWELEILPARLERYDPEWLDELTLTGEFVWGRCRPPRSNGPAGPGLSRVVPVSFMRRAELSWLLNPERWDARDSLSAFRSNTQDVYAALAAHGALYFDELVAVTGLLAGHVSAALAELAAHGAVAADGFAAVRPLITKRLPASIRRRRQRVFQSNAGGRWSRFPAVRGVSAPTDRVQRWAWQLLHRYGVMFRDLLARESVAPPWNELVREYRQLEARGEIRGGRFVAGVAGEQFALPRAVEALRRIRDRGPDGSVSVLAAADPLNLVGILTPGPRLTVTKRAAVAVRDGRVVATRHGRDIKFHEPIEPAAADQLGVSLRRSAATRMRLRV